MRDFRLLIDGKLVAGATSWDVINPATEEVLAQAPCGDMAQLEAAIGAAKAAFPTWAALPIAERRAMLVRLAEALEAKEGEFARLLTEEQGKPLAAAASEISRSAGMIRYFASLDLQPEVLQEDATQKIMKYRVPLGVVAAITAWNFPMLILMVKIAPALLAGNTVVAKPAPTTPLTTLRFGEICAEILPPGVINIIADRNDLGAALSSHPDIAKISFTGSTATGRKVMQGAAATLKRLTLELGGNDAALALDDVDVEEVAAKIYAIATLNAGQVCLAIKRLYVHDSQYDQFCDALARLARETVVDDGLKQGTQMGPIQNKAQFEKVKGFIEDARREGKIVAGGEIPDRKGYFVPPTIVRDVPDSARIVAEEQFGPILPILRYSQVDEAVRRINDTDYGLGGSVWSRNIERALETALKIESGTVWINRHTGTPANVAVNGSKQSGFGTELGQGGLEEFTLSKVVQIAK